MTRLNLFLLGALLASLYSNWKLYDTLVLVIDTCEIETEAL